VIVERLWSDCGIAGVCAYLLRGPVVRGVHVARVVATLETRVGPVPSVHQLLQVAQGTVPPEGVPIKATNQVELQTSELNQQQDANSPQSPRTA
jgi:hypothetical protein